MYLETLALPIDEEEDLIEERAEENGGCFGYITNEGKTNDV